MFRIVRTPGLGILIDAEAEKPGRGAYLCSDEGCLERVVKERRIEQVLKAHVPPGVREEVRRRLCEIPKQRGAGGG